VAIGELVVLEDCHSAKLVAVLPRRAARVEAARRRPGCERVGPPVHRSGLRPPARGRCSQFAPASAV